MDISKIDASLEYGRLVTGGWLALLYFGLIVPLLLPLISIGVIITILSGAMEWDVIVIVALVLCSAFGLFIATVFAYLIYRNRKTKEKVILYLQDAVQAKAISKTLDIYKGLGQPLKEVKIQVNFTINAVNYTRISGVSESKKSRNGYDKIFAKYADRKINILYSPKYNQVLLLKD